MKYPYIVNRNGVWYPSGAEVPDDKPIPTKSETKNYTKTDINRMPVDELREMAKKTGVENAETMTGAELKKYILDVFRL